MVAGLQNGFSKWLQRRPRKGLGRAAFWLLAWFLLLTAMRWLPGVAGGLAAGLQITVGVVLAMVSIPLMWTAIRTHLLWSLRNKLVLTYLLIGLAPVVLLVTLVLVSAYVAAGQFAIHLVDTRVQGVLAQMGSENAGKLRQLLPLIDGRTTREAMAAELPVDDRQINVPVRLRRETVCYIDGISVFRARAGRRAPFGLAPWAAATRGGRFRGIVADGGELYLVALHQQKLSDGRMFTVVSSQEINRELIDLLADDLGIVRFRPEKSGDAPDATDAQNVRQDTTANNQKTYARKETRRERQHILTEIPGGRDPRALNSADIRVRFPSTLETTDWAVGKADNVVVEVDSRPSLLYQQLFGASLSGWIMNAIKVSLMILLLVFGALWLTAFVMAVRLTRTMTESVADLYDATQRVDRGDLEHKIVVKRTDQLAELSRSFNSMTGSLQRLLVEQKEKERLQNELSIAQEVQANLFPHGATDLPSLELHGVCRPARSVSGDYYDFLVFQEDVPSASGGRPVRREAGVGIAIGDISGKGISAALLMATLHSAVRAYQFASEELVYSKSAVEGLTASKEGLADAGGWFQSPGRIMSLLNRHLFRSTQPEKYATLFLAHYDSSSSVLTYSNAGQLPPFVLGRDGSVRRLEEGGTVVGLMDGMHFDEGRLTMQSGDILVAYSDGVTEPENDFGDFGETRLLEVVSRYRTQPLHVISAQVMLALDAWIGAEEQPDDITLVLARQH